MLSKVSVMILGLLGAVACKPIDFSPDLCAEVSGTELVLRNQSNTPVHYVVFEQELASRIDWIASCKDDNQIKSQNLVRLPFSSIAGYRSDARVVIYWWRCSNGNPKSTDHSFVLSTNTPGTQCVKVR